MKIEVSKNIKESTAEPFVRGKQSEYDSKMCKVVIETAKEGGFHAAMRVRLGISEITFNKYRKEHPEFDEAVKFADDITLAMQEELLYLGARGLKDYDFKANAFILNNKYKKLYENKGSGNTEINVNTLNLTPDQVEQKILQKIEKLRSMGIEWKPQDDNIINVENNDSNSE